MPKVSICLPVYNGERYLAQAIESVLAQTCADFELLIADDCSQDESRTIVDSYARHDDRIRIWQHEKNQGLFANYNFLIARASAPIVKLFAQDDVLLPESVLRSVEVLERHPEVVLVSHARRWIDADGTDISDRHSSPQADSFVQADTVVASHTVLMKSLVPVVNFIGEPSTVAFRRTESLFFDPKFHHLGDLDYWLRILVSGDYYYISEALCQFRRHENSTSQFNTERLLFLPDHLRIWRNMSASVDGLCETEFMENMLVSCAGAVHFFEKEGRLSVASVRSTKLEPSKLSLEQISSHANSADAAPMTEVETPSVDGTISLENYEQLLDELKDFREITYRSCKLIGDRLSGLGTNNVSELYENEQRIRRLKRSRRKLLRSVPKSSALRGINRQVGLETAKLQEVYIRFLRAQLWLIRTFQSKRKRYADKSDQTSASASGA